MMEKVMFNIQQKQQLLWNPLNLGGLFKHWWTQLQKHNREVCQKKCLPRTSPFIVLNSVLVETVFIICSKLHQPAEVRFLAVELLDRFMMYHYEQLHKHIWQDDDKAFVCKEQQWKRVIARVHNQLLLRTMSCIQLASKAITNNKKLSPLAVMEFLKCMGHKFTLQSVMTSERRVFHTLDFKLPLSNALTYVELMLSYLHNAAVDLDAMYSVSVHILDIAYLRHQHIYMKLFQKITGRVCPTPSERRQFEEVKCDNIFLAYAVVTSASILLETDTATISAHLNKLVQLEKSDIHELSLIIVHTVLE